MKSRDDRLKVSIIGCGDIGFRFDYGKKIRGALTHFKAFSSDKNFIIASIAEFNEKTRSTIKRKFGVNVFENYEDMLGECISDVIVVASNDESHPSILKKLIDYSPRFVFCEKPVALNYGDAKEIVEQYEAAGIPLMINFTRRFMNEFEGIRRIIESGKTGEIQSITFYYSRGLVHNASHYLDLVNWYIGETEKNLIKVSSRNGFNETDDTVSFDLIYQDGLEVRFIGLDCGKLSFAEIDIVGTEGRIKINYRNELEYFKVISNRNFRGYYSYKLQSVKSLRFEKALPNAAENIYRYLSGKQNLKSPAINSIKVFELINRIKAKSYA